jgi:hypothetical protein
MIRFDSVIKRYPDSTVTHDAGRTGRHAAANDYPSGAVEHASPW